MQVIKLASSTEFATKIWKESEQFLYLSYSLQVGGSDYGTWRWFQCYILTLPLKFCHL